MYRSVCFHISYNKKYIWISIIVKRQNFMVTPHVHREWRYHWARDNVIDIYMVPIVYYVGFDQWTCTWAGVQKPRGWLTHRYSRQILSRTLTLWIKFTSHGCQIGLESDSTANALCELHSWQRYIFWQLTRLLQMFFRVCFWSAWLW